MRSCKGRLKLALAFGLSSAGSLHPATAGDISFTGDVTYESEVVSSNNDLDKEYINLTVGHTGQGSGLVSNGATLGTIGGTYLGEKAGAQGEVTVTGASSQWLAEDMFVGAAGQGNLIIQDGGNVTIGALAIAGSDAGSLGTISLSGPGTSLLSSIDLVLGYSGEARFSVTDGAEVDVLGSSRFSVNPGSSSTITISGDGTEWRTLKNLDIGYGGDSTLTIDGFAKVGSVKSSIGYSAGSSGTVIVSGNDGTGTFARRSEWEYDSLQIGLHGTGNLTIADGGWITAASETVMATASGSTGTATVTGAESVWYQQGALTVGKAGRAELTIQDGGTVETYGGAAIVGQEVGGTGTATVTGPGSLWNIENNALVIGDYGQGTLFIEDGGAVISETGSIGGNGFSTHGHGEVTVTGAGSSWKTRTLVVGNGGGGSGVLTIDDGGEVEAISLILGNSGVGTLNLNGTDGHRGSLLTYGVSAVPTLGRINFNGGILKPAQSGTLIQSGVEVILHDGGAFIDTGTSDSIISASMDGVGGLTKLGSGTLTLTGYNSYQGVTQVEHGTLLWGGTPPFDVGGFVQGGAYVVNGGSLDLGTNHGYNPIHPERFALAMSSLSGTGGGVNLNTGELIVDQVVTTDYAGVISGSGGLTKLGSGRLSLSGDNTYTGKTIVGGGTLAVNGSLASEVLVGPDGSLEGTGAVNANVLNEGVVAPGNSIGTLAVNGSYSQSAEGVLRLESDFAAGKIDRLEITGDASLAGKLQVSAASLLPRIALPFLSAGGSLSQSLSVDSALFDFEITGTSGALSIAANSAHFADPGMALTGQQKASANHLQEIWNVGGGTFGTLFGVLGFLADTAPASYASALSDLTPGASGAASAASVSAAQDHLGMLMSCPVFAPGTSLLVETSCAWSQGSAQVMDQQVESGAAGFQTSTYALQAGAQYEVRPDWFVGFAGGYDRSFTRSDDDRAKADGDTLHAGLSVKHQTGGWLFAGAMSGSYGWYGNSRSIRIPGLTATAKSDQDIYTFGTRARAAYTFAMAPFYVRPLVDLDLIYSHAGGYREAGAGVLDLQVSSRDQWSFHATPALEVGTQVSLGETVVLRAFAGAGVSFGSADTWETHARLISAPAGTGTFQSDMPLPGTTGRIYAGVDIASGNGFSLRTQYSGGFSDSTSSHSGTLRLSYRF